MLKRDEKGCRRKKRNAVRPRRRFLGDSRGSAAVEFAIIAPIFLGLMFSMFEIGWFYFANSVTDAATTTAGRLIRTGQVQKWSGSDEEVFKQFYDTICDVVDSFGECGSHMTVEVTTFKSFEDLAADTTDIACADSDPNEIDAIPFEPGGELQIVRVRVCLLFNTVNPAIGVKLAEDGTGVRRIKSTMIFRNEPYEKNKKK